jgi:hypothetical protein
MLRNFLYKYYLISFKNLIPNVIALRMMILKVKRVQDYKEPKVEMYKLIWGLVFKCNGSGRQFNLIQFS